MSDDWHLKIIRENQARRVRAFFWLVMAARYKTRYWWLHDQKNNTKLKSLLAIK